MEKEEKVIGDMYLAAAFLAYKITLDHVDRSIPRKQKFIFIRDCPLTIVTVHSNIPLVVHDATLSDLEVNFASDTLMLPPTYPDAIRKVKSLLHSDDVNDLHLERK